MTSSGIASGSVSLAITADPASPDVDGRPFRNPVDFWDITSQLCAGHPTGIDIALPGRVPVRAAEGGEVIWASPEGAYGNLIMIQHESAYLTLYGHLSSLYITVGQRVGAGQLIGLSGGDPDDPGAGHSTGDHLHLEILFYGSPANPLTHIAGPWTPQPGSCYTTPIDS